MKLIDNWKDWWKMWSIRVNVLIGLGIAVAANFPETFLHLWVLVPAELQQQLMSVEGASFAIMATLVISSIARLVKQEKLHTKTEETEEKDAE